VIGARGFLLVWADSLTNQNTGLPGSALHADFQLSASGEEIGLFAPDGVTPQSTVIFGMQTQNVSQGCFPDGLTNHIIPMTNATPASANTPFGPIRITQLSINAGVVTLTWSAIPGRNYRVEYQPELSPAGWIQLGAVIMANDSTASINDTPPPNGHRFYRVLRVDE